jgi:hypothetical protein
MAPPAGHVPRARCPAISLCVYRSVILAVRTRASWTEVSSLAYRDTDLSRHLEF